MIQEELSQTILQTVGPLDLFGGGGWVLGVGFGWFWGGDLLSSTYWFL